MADENINRPTTSAARRGPRSRTPPGPQSLAAAIELQHQRVIQIRALVESQGKILHESYEFDPQEADLGFCCEGVSIVLSSVIASLQRVAVSPEAITPSDPLALARAINAPRMELFAAQASAQAIENLMRDYDFGDEADLHVVMGSIADQLGEVTQAIEPEKLGLPNPTS